MFSTISGFYDFLMCFSVDKSVFWGACMIVFHYFGGKIPDFPWGGHKRHQRGKNDAHLKPFSQA